MDEQRPLIIGYGNPLRGDDGIGWHMAQCLHQHHPATLQVIACQQLTPDLAAPISRAARVIFIDAAWPTAGPHLPAAPHTLPLCYRPVTPEPFVNGSLNHHLTPEALLAWALLLYHAHPPAFVLSVASTTFHSSEQLSPAMHRTLPLLLDCVWQLVATAVV